MKLPELTLGGIYHIPFDGFDRLTAGKLRVFSSQKIKKPGAIRLPA